MFNSWRGERARTYRRINRIPGDWGTAVNIQKMVFGNKRNTSGSGVAFRRDEVTGASALPRDFLPNADGEDVVSGVRNTLDIAEMALRPAGCAQPTDRVLRALEGHYDTIQDTELTGEEGCLYMLQTRSAKRLVPIGLRAS